MKEAELVFPGGLLLLLIRTFALWIYVPIGLIAWVFTFPWLVRIGATLGQYLGWLDVNFVYLLMKTILRPFTKGSIPEFISAADIPSVQHRIGYLDAY